MTDKPDAGEARPQCCPFCGEGVRALSRYHPRDPNEWYVSCGAKDCVMQPETPTYRTEAEAVAAWNHRPSSKRIEELEKALGLVRGIIMEAAITGFNWADGDWAERLFASQAVTHAALSPSNGGGK